MYSAVIFDLDGTLLNTIDDLADAGNYALRQAGLPTHTVAQFKRLVGHGIPRLIQDMVPQPPRQSDIERVTPLFLRYYDQHKEDKTRPYPGMIALLDALREKGVRLAVVSNKAHDLACAVVRHYFGERFETVCGAKEGVPTKPHPAAVRAVVEQLGLPDGRVLYVGDSDVDMQTARNAGLANCGVLWGFRTADELTAAGADRLAATCDELEAIVLENLSWPL